MITWTLRRTLPHLTVVLGALLVAISPARATTRTWTGGGGDVSWHNAANWSPVGAPATDDDVVIGSGFATISYSTGTTSISSIQSDSTLSLNGGTLTIGAGGGAFGDQLILNGATLGGTGTVNISGLFTWNSGTVRGAGVLNANGGIAMSGPGDKYIFQQRVVNNAGTATFAGTGGIRIDSGGVWNNLGSSIFEIQNNAAINSFGTLPYAFNNYGTLRKTSSGQNDVYIPFNNAGLVDIQNGTLSLNGGGTHGGRFDGAGALQLGGGTHNLQTTSEVTCRNVSFAAVIFPAVSDIHGRYDLSGGGTSSNAGTATFHSDAAVAYVGPLSMSVSGRVTFSSGELISTPSLTMADNAILGGTDTVEVSGPFTWTGGTVRGAGTLNAIGGITMSGADGKLVDQQRVLNNAGLATFAGTGGIRIDSGGVWNNLSGSIFEIQNIAEVNSFGNLPYAFNNNGTLRKTSSGQNDIYIPLNNAGLVDIQAGTLSLDDGGAHSGAFQGAGTLQLAGGTHNFQITSAITCNSVRFSLAPGLSVAGITNVHGAYDLSGGSTSSNSGTATFHSDAAVAYVGPLSMSVSGRITFSSGELIRTPSLTMADNAILGGTDTVEVSGPFTWTGGTVRGAGTLNAIGGITMSGADGKLMDQQRVLNNAGLATFAGTGTLVVDAGGIWNNLSGSTFEIQNAAVINGGSSPPFVFNNNGTLRKTSSGQNDIYITFNNAGLVDIQNGTLSVYGNFTQTGGRTLLDGGSLSKPGGAVLIQGGSLGGTGTVTGTVNNSGGSVAPGTSAGSLTITGNYSQGPGAMLEIEVGGATPGTHFDRLVVGGTASLDGTLYSTLINGFDPTPADSFTFLSAGTRTGTFAIVGPCNDTVAYTSGSAALSFDRAPAVASAGNDQSVAEGTFVTLDGSASESSCGQSVSGLTYAWTQVAGGSVTLDLTDPARPTFTAPQVPMGGATLTFELVVHDGVSGSAPEVVNITVTNINHAPVAAADGPEAVTEGGVAVLDGSHSYDDDDEALTYSWQQIGGTLVVLSDGSSAMPSFTAPLVGSGGETLTFQLTVSDSIASDVDTISVLIENVNHLPVANAGADQTRAEGANITLDASASNDSDGDALSFSWTQMSGPAVALTGGDTAAPSFTAPQVNATETLVFRVLVDDGYGGSDDDEVTVTVQDVGGNSPPACDLARPSVAELWPPNHKLVAVSILGVTDPDTNMVTINILNITQDEPIDGLGDGDTAPDAVIQGGTVLLRAERAGNRPGGGAGNGRVYRVTFQADDGAGGTCTGTVNVCVPHSKGRNATPCIDDGQIHGSLRP